MRLRTVVLPLVAALVAATGATGAGAADPTWVPTQPVQTGSQDRLAALPDGTVWAVVDHNRILRSTDAGMTWLPVNPVPAQVAEAPLPLSGPALGGSSDTYVAPESATVAMGANGDAVSVTRDGGLTWTPLSTPHVTKSQFFEFTDQLERTGGSYWYAKNGNEVVGNCPYPLTTTPVLTSSTGKTWRRTDIPLAGGQVSEIRFLDQQRGAVLVTEIRWTGPTRSGNSCSFSGEGSSSAVFTTADAGRHWRRAWTCKPLCWGLSWSSPGRLMVARGDGRVDLSKDGGATFRQLAPVPVGNVVSSGVGFLQALDCVGARCWVSVNGGGVFRYDGSGEWNKEISSEDAVGLAIGDLAAVDHERAVQGGPTALSYRVATGTAGTASVASPLVSGAVSGPVVIGPGTTVDAAGVVHRQATLTR
jgi:photosystem II stability/assembly factor-like uncharacterized protein